MRNSTNESELSWRASRAVLHSFAGDAFPGYCSLTEREGNCSTDWSGFWKAGRNSGIRTLDDCVAKCRQCPRCSAVSLSLQSRLYSECSWYSACALSDLRRPPVHGKDYTSLYVKRAEPVPRLTPSPGAQPDRGLSVTIATMCLGAASRCALVQWCERASLLAWTLRRFNGWRVRLVVIASKPSASQADATAIVPDPRDCARATFLPPDADLVAAISSCKRSKAHTGTDEWEKRGAMFWVGLYKWMLMSRTEDDYIIMSDIDVDLFAERAAKSSPEAVARVWATQTAPGGHKDWVHAVANADYSSPLNMGILVLRPSGILYEDGLRVLRACAWNKTHGWQLAGPPRSLGLRPMHPDGTEVVADVKSKPHLVSKRTDWRFFGASGDQGFYWYMLYIRHRVGAYFKLSASPHRVLHWWGNNKPWLMLDSAVSSSGISNRVMSKVYAYLSHSALLGGDSPNATACKRQLFLTRQRIEDDARFYSLSSYVASNVPGRGYFSSYMW